MAFKPAKRDNSAFTLQHRFFMEEYFQHENHDKCIYDHQHEALVAVKNQLDDVEQPNIALVVLPTGCGKTGVAVLAPYVLDSRRVLVLTPTNAISEQIFDAFDGGSDDENMFLVQRGIVKKEDADDVRPIASLIIKTDQIRRSLHNDVLIITAHQVSGRSRVKIQDIPPEGYDLVIVDEAHHYPADTWQIIVNHFPNSKRLFLTATPCHSKQGYILEEVKRSLAGFKEDAYIRIDVCYELRVEEAIARGIIRNRKFDEVGVSKNDDDETVMKV